MRRRFQTDDTQTGSNASGLVLPINALVVTGEIAHYKQASRTIRIRDFVR